MPYYIHKPHWFRRGLKRKFKANKGLHRDCSKASRAYVDNHDDSSVFRSFRPFMRDSRHMQKGMVKYATK